MNLTSPAPFGNRPATVRFAIGIAIYAVALSVRLALLSIAPRFPFVPFSVAAVIVFYLCGLGPGILAAALGAATVLYLGVPGEWRWMQRWIPAVAVLGYAVITILIGWLMERGRLTARLADLNREQESMLDNELVGILKLRGGKAIWRNRALEAMLGYGAGDPLGEDMRTLYADDESYRRFDVEAYPSLRDGGTFRTQVRLVRKDGHEIWVDMSGVMLSAERDESMWLLLDITELKRYQEQVEGMAFRDGLTGLPNRTLLLDRIRHALPLSERTHRELAVCFIDLDGFKEINDRFGHDAGDRLLQAVAVRMEACLRGNDTVARLGGDEFVLVLAQLHSRDECQEILGRVLEFVREPVAVTADRSAAVSASIGVALCPEDGTVPEFLLARADAAMYAAKRAGRNQVRYFHERAAERNPAATSRVLAIAEGDSSGANHPEPDT